MPRPLSRQSGLTLIELMIAALLGLLLMAALGYLYVGNRQAFRTQESVARLQENGRYAMEVLAQDLRMAGYIGCNSVSEVALTMTAPLPALTVNNVVQGTEAPDTLTLSRVDGRGVSPTAAMASPSSSISIPASPRQYAAGTPFLIADCLRADVFLSSAQINQGATAIAHAAPPNSSSDLSAAYGTDAMLFPYEVVTYAIANNPSGNPSLYRSVNGVNQEVVENIKDMQIVYGIDMDNDGAVNAYVTANNVANWAQVLAVRVSLLLRSAEAGVAAQPPAVFWDMDNDGTNDLDPTTDPDVQARRLLYVYTTTIGLRNRLR